MMKASKFKLRNDELGHGIEYAITTSRIEHFTEYVDLTGDVNMVNNENTIVLAVNEGLSTSHAIEFAMGLAEFLHCPGVKEFNYITYEGRQIMQMEV